MDKFIEKAFEISNLMVTLGNQKRLLKEEYEQSLFYFYNGGTFKATKETITYIKTLKDLDVETDIVVVDENGMPIRIDSITNFLQELLNQHFQASNKYFSDYQKLKKSKSVESILNV